MKILCLIDPSFTMDSDDELEEIKSHFENDFPNEKWEFKGLVGEVQNFLDGKADVYVYDFGGIGITGAHGLVISTHRAVAEKIENEPGRLFIFWSQFTSEEFWYQAEEEFPELIKNENVLTRPNYREHDEFNKKIAIWLGIPEKEK